MIVTSCSKSGDSTKVESPVIQEASISAVVGQEDEILLDLGSVPYGKSKDGLVSIKQNQIALLEPSALVNGKLLLSEDSSPELSILSQSGCTSIKKSTGTCNIKIRANSQGLSEGSVLQGSILFHTDPLTEVETIINITAVVGEPPIVENPTALVSSTSSSLNFGELSISDKPKDLIVTYGKLLVGGLFTQYNGIPLSTPYIARLNEDGTLDSSFSLAGAGLNSLVNSIEYLSSGHILVGGNFTQYNDIITNRIVRLNNDGSLDSTFDLEGTGFNTQVFDIKIMPDGKLLVGGQFTQFNNTNFNYILKLEKDGEMEITQE